MQSLACHTHPVKILRRAILAGGKGHSLLSKLYIDMITLSTGRWVGKVEVIAYGKRLTRLDNVAGNTFDGRCIL